MCAELKGKDLFGKTVRPRKRLSRLEASLRRYDVDSFDERLGRLQYVQKVFPHGMMLGADQETVYIFGETKMAFINGEFISTVLLAQAFIERILQSHYEALGHGKVARQGLSAILKHAKKNRVLHDYLIDKADALRLKRNPFTHLKPFDHEFTMSQRMIREYSSFGVFRQPIEIMAADAKDAITLMYAVVTTKLGLGQ